MIHQNNMFDEYPDVVSIDDLSRMLRVCPATAYKIIKKGEIKSLRIGHVYRIPKVYVINYLRAEDIVS